MVVLPTDHHRHEVGHDLTGRRTDPRGKGALAGGKREGRQHALVAKLGDDEGPGYGQHQRHAGKLTRSGRRVALRLVVIGITVQSPGGDRQEREAGDNGNGRLRRRGRAGGRAHRHADALEDCGRQHKFEHHRAGGVAGSERRG